jgi:hypothetical protein
VIREILPVGQENAISCARLAEILDMDLREVTRQVERERKSGAPICATTTGENRGYYLADGPGELALYCKSLDRRLLSIKKTRSAIERTLVKMIDQTEVDGW